MGKRSGGIELYVFEVFCVFLLANAHGEPHQDSFMVYYELLTFGRGTQAESAIRNLGTTTASVK